MALKIALGTTSESKRKFLNEVLSELSLPADIESFEVKSGVTDQPMSLILTKKGSVNRAKRALSCSSNADIGLGIEVGYSINKDGDYEMFCFASIVKRSRETISAQSHKLKLPSFHQKILKENKYLGDFVRQFLAENPDPISQEVGIIIRDRKPFIQMAVKTVLLSYLR